MRQKISLGQVQSRFLKPDLSSYLKVFHVSFFCLAEDPQFTDVVRAAELAIEHGNYPERIYQGEYASLSSVNNILQVLVLFYRLFRQLLREEYGRGIGKKTTSNLHNENFIFYFESLRKPLVSSSQKMKSPMVASIPNGPSGCTAYVAHVSLDAPVWFPIRATCRRQVLQSSTKNWDLMSYHAPKW